MAEEIKKETEVVAEGTPKTPAVEAENTDTATAPAGDEPAAVAEPPVSPEGGDADADDLITLLNEIDMAFDGPGGITELPENLQRVFKTMVGKMSAFVEIIEDPKFKALFDDLIDQKEDGNTPSVDVAIARTLPIEEIMKLAEGGDEGAAQEAVNTRLADDKTKADDEANLEANIDGSIAEFESYSAEMGYDDTEKADLHKVIKKLFDIFADGKITAAEYSEIDKMRNYDKDMADMKAQVPAEPSKTVLPDTASMEAAIAPAAPTPQKPKNSIESMAAQQYSGVDVTDVGKRKRSPMGRS